MVYIAQHKRTVIGEKIHETFKEKKKKEEEKSEQIEQIFENKKIQEETERNKVETEYLTPKIENWIETDSVKLIKERVKTWLSLGYPIHLIGPTGCGKTTLALQIAKEFNRPVVWINGDESITTTDLIGGYSQVEMNSIRDKFIHNVFKDKDILKAEWIDNPLTLACKYGYTLIYNEFSRSRAVANNVLLSIFSEGILELPTKFGEERYVKVHPEFRAIFTSNSIEYAGVHRAQDALLDRMVGIYMDYYDKQTETKIIAAQSRIDEKHALLVADLLELLRKKSPEEAWVGTRAGIMVAKAMKSANTYDKQGIKQFLSDVVTSKTKNTQHFNEKIKLIQKL